MRRELVSPVSGVVRVRKKGMKSMRKRVQVIGVVVATVLWGMATLPVLAGDGNCDRCGHGESHKVCRLICEKKVIEIPCYSTRRETICVGGPCELGCRHGESVCHDGPGNDKQSCPSCSRGRTFAYQETIPGCPKQYTRKVLLRRKVKKEVTVYRWVVEDLCHDCEAKLPPSAAGPTTPMPTPRVDAVVVPANAPGPRPWMRSR